MGPASHPAWQVFTTDNGPEHFKFFAGYVEWGPGQLKDECNRGDWWPVLPASLTLIKTGY